MLNVIQTYSHASNSSGISQLSFYSSKKLLFEVSSVKVSPNLLAALNLAFSGIAILCFFRKVAYATLSLDMLNS